MRGIRRAFVPKCECSVDKDVYCPQKTVTVYTFCDALQNVYKKSYCLMKVDDSLPACVQGVFTGVCRLSASFQLQMSTVNTFPKKEF